MIERDSDNFYSVVYKLFYKFSETQAEQVGIVFTRGVVYPVLELNPKLHFKIPLPKMFGDKYAFEGMLFENTEEGRVSLWAVFLSMIFHLSGHAAVSDYSIYNEWRKHKTTDLSWQVIDFIEDVRAQRYISQNNEVIWNNIVRIESSLENCLQIKNNQADDTQKKKLYAIEDDEKKFDALRKTILQYKGENNEGILTFADSLYYNRQLLKVDILPNHEQHKPMSLLKFENSSPKIKPFGIFQEYSSQLNDLWEKEESARRKLLAKYAKHLKNLKFDKVVVPEGDLQYYEEVKTSILPMVRKIKQQLRLIANLNDYPKTDQIGYVDMQMAIQAIASEGATTDIFERDEIRRGEEAWVILIDSSASMQLRFEKIKEFAVCVAEAANDLTGNANNWSLYTFDSNFHVLKDFTEKYNEEVKARLGCIKNGGLSLLPDALLLSYKILANDPRDKKYIFLLTDGHPSGYDRIHEAFSKVIKKTEVSGITLIGIGVSKKATRRFANSVRGKDLTQLVAKFITAYKTAAADM
jgi:uncharacterized protein YegL